MHNAKYQQRQWTLPFPNTFDLVRVPRKRDTMSSTSVSPKKRKAPSRTTAKHPASAPPKSRIISATTAVGVEVTPINPEHDPIVVSFPRGVPASIATTRDSDDVATNSPPRFTCSKLKESSSRGRVISGEDNDCTYTASAQGRGHDGRLTKVYVGIYNKKSKTLKLVPAAEKGTVFALEQKVKGYTPNVVNGSLLIGGAQTQNNDAGVTMGTVSAANQVQLLVESFGSRKKQKVMASRAANKVNIHSVVGSGDVMMKSVTKQEGISAENKKKIEEGGGTKLNANDAALEQARMKLLPPYDINADAPSKVYNAQVISGDAAWDQVSRIVEKVLKTKESENDPDWIDALLGKNKSHRPQSITNLLSNINPTSPKKTKKGGGGGANYRIKVAFFLFLTLKFHFKLQRKNGVIEGATLDDCITELYVPHDVAARLIELFASEMDGPNNGYVMSKQQKSKLTAYILILFVIASGNEMKVSSINQLCRDIKLDEKEAMLFLREAGFTVKKSGGGDIGVSLSVPLTFPPPKRGKRT